MKRIFWTVVLLGAFLAGDAWALRADEAENGQQPRLDAEILTQLGAPQQAPGWFSNSLREIKITGTGELTYQPAVPLQFGETRVEFRILGPGLTLQQGKAVGLRFEFRF